MCRDIVNEWKPDLIHIHGTESCFGLLSARGLVKCPVVISLQGLLGPYSEWRNFFGNSKLLDIIRMHRWLDIPTLRGKWIEFLKIRKAAKREREIITGNQFFLGRTTWDRAVIEAINPAVHYYHGGELLRGAFWRSLWDIKHAKKQRIMFINAGHPRKGAEIVFEAIKLLQPNYPDIHIAIAGAISRRSGYGRHIRRQIAKLGNAATELGPLDAEQITEEMMKSHVFVSPSFIENSSNAVCEAQLMGMPVIASYTGGLPSLIKDGVTGLFFPVGDAPILAARVRQVLENDQLAVQLGSQAREVAVKRHDDSKIVQDILSVYEDVMRHAGAQN
jgi:glycosyltransferase involved in cell wall biosynthesis